MKHFGCSWLEVGKIPHRDVLLAMEQWSAESEYYQPTESDDSDAEGVQERGPDETE